MDEPLWHYEGDGRSVGPFSRSDLEGLQRAGLIDRETILIAADGIRVPADQVLGGQAPSPQWTIPSVPETVPPPPPLPVSLSRQTSSAPWSPRALVWLGVPFSPIWSGVMAAVNARRLGLASPWWRPVVIGVGAFLASEAVSLFGFDSYLLMLGLYFGALLLLWQTDLEAQQKAFQSREPGPRADWLVPCLLGLPATLAVLVVFVVAPLLPASPREVSEAFLSGASSQAAKSLTTTKLWPALDALSAAPASSDRATMTYEILGEETAPSDLGGHLVGYRVLRNTAAGTETGEGILHLVERGGRWKIEEVIYTVRSGQSLDEPVRLSDSFRQVIAQGGDARMLSSQRMIASQKPNPPSEPKTSFSNLPKPLKDLKIDVVLNRILASGLGKAGLLFLSLLGFRSFNKQRK